MYPQKLHFQPIQMLLCQPKLEIKSSFRVMYPALQNRKCIGVGMGVKIHECRGSLETKCTYVIQRASFMANNGVYECVGENMVKLVAEPLTLEIQGIIYLSSIRK